MNFIKINHITDIDICNQNIFIVGKPASGKTFASNILNNRFTKHLVIHTDNFIKAENLLYQEYTKNISLKHNCILEGKLALSLFPKLDKNFQPNIILELIVSDEHVRNIYQKQRDINKYEMALDFYSQYKQNFDKHLKKLNPDIQYFTLINEHTGI